MSWNPYAWFRDPGDDIEEDLWDRADEYRKREKEEADEA